MSDSQREQAGQHPAWGPAQGWHPDSFIDHVPTELAQAPASAADVSDYDRFAPPESVSSPGAVPPQFSAGAYGPQGGQPAFPGWGPPPPISATPPAPQQPQFPSGQQPQYPPAPQPQYPAAHGSPTPPPPPMTMASPVQRPVQISQQPMQQQAPQQVAQQSPVPSAPPPVDVRYDDPYTATMLKEPSPRPAAAEPPRKEPPRKEAKRSGGLVPIVGALVGGLVLGLGLGAGAYFGGLVPARGTAAAPASTAPASVAPKQVEVTVDKFPAQFLGMTRDDLDGSANAAAARTSAEALSKSMEASYGGPGIQMSYGSGKGPIALVWVQNGFLPAPVATVDYQIVRSQQMTSWIEIPGTPTTQCRLANYPAVKVASAGEIEAAKQSVFNGKGDGYIVCVRHDEKRNVSVQVGVQKWGTTDTRAQIAVKTAAALDEAWAALTK